jgi:hypothetical protein
MYTAPATGTPLGGTVPRSSMLIEPVAETVASDHWPAALMAAPSTVDALLATERLL